MISIMLISDENSNVNILEWNSVDMFVIRCEKCHLIYQRVCDSKVYFCRFILLY